MGRDISVLYCRGKMGMVVAFHTAVGRWVGFLLLWLQWGDGQGLHCSDCS